MRLFNHPVHTAVIHFPIAFCSVAPLAELAGLLAGAPAWSRLAFQCMVLGLATSVPALVTGFVDFVQLPERDEVESAAFRHLGGVGVALSLFLAGLLVRGGMQPASTGHQWLAVGCWFAGVGALLAGAWYGGELVLRYGVGGIDDIDEQTE